MGRSGRDQTLSVTGNQQAEGSMERGQPAAVAVKQAVEVTVAEETVREPTRRQGRQADRAEGDEHAIRAEVTQQEAREILRLDGYSLSETSDSEDMSVDESRLEHRGLYTQQELGGGGAAVRAVKIKKRKRRLDFQGSGQENGHLNGRA